METLKLIGAGHKVLLVKDDVVKYIDLGGLFSSKKEEKIFSPGDFSSIEVKEPRIRKGYIQLHLSNQDTVLSLEFSGDENYRIAFSMKQHIQLMADVISEDGIEQEQSRSIYDELKRLYPQEPYSTDDFEGTLAQIDSFISTAQDMNPVDFEYILKSESFPLYSGSEPQHQVFGRALSLADVLHNINQIRNNILGKLRSQNEYEEYLVSIPVVPLKISPAVPFSRLKLGDIGEIKTAPVTKKFNRDALVCFVVIDVETTGLRPATDDIIELSAIKFVDYKAEEAFTTLIKPPHGLKKAAQAINQISQDMVDSAPTIEQVMPAFIEFCGDYPLVGHNIFFDLKFLYVNGFPLKPKKKYFDTLQLSKKAINDISNYKLDTICHYFKIYRNSSHRALSDCLATGILFDEITKHITED